MQDTSGQASELKGINLQLCLKFVTLDGSSIVDDHEYFTQNVIADVDNEYHVFTDAKSRINVWLAIHIVSEIGKRGNHHLKFEGHLVD